MAFDPTALKDPATGPAEGAEKDEKDDGDSPDSENGKADTSGRSDRNGQDNKDAEDEKGQGDKKTEDGNGRDDDTPEQRYESRFPQPVTVADVVGKPMIATDNGSLGVVSAVVRSGDGKMKLIVPFGGFLGFGRRPVAVPLEVVGSIGTAIVSLDMDRTAFAAAPTWIQRDETILSRETPMRIAIARH